MFIIAIIRATLAARNGKWHKHQLVMKASTQEVCAARFDGMMRCLSADLTGGMQLYFATGDKPEPVEDRPRSGSNAWACRGRATHGLERTPPLAVLGQVVPQGKAGGESLQHVLDAILGTGMWAGSGRRCW